MKKRHRRRGGQVFRGWPISSARDGQTQNWPSRKFLEPKHYILLPSVTAGAVGTSDPVRSPPPGLGPPGGGVTRPFSTLPGASPGRSGPGVGGRPRAVAPWVFLRSSLDGSSRTLKWGAFYQVRTGWRLERTVEGFSGSNLKAGKHFLAPKLQEGGESCSLTLSFPASFKLKTLLWFPPLGSSLEAVMKSHFL